MGGNLAYRNFKARNEAFKELQQYFTEKHAMGILDLIISRWDPNSVQAWMPVSTYRSIIAPWLDQFIADKYVECNVTTPLHTALRVRENLLNVLPPELRTLIRVSMLPWLCEKGEVVYGR